MIPPGVCKPLHFMCPIRSLLLLSSPCATEAKAGYATRIVTRELIAQNSS